MTQNFYRPIDIDSKEIKIELFDYSDCDFGTDLNNKSIMTEEEENDESKILYNLVGFAKVMIDDAFKGIIMNRDLTYYSQKPIFLENEENEESNDLILGNYNSNNIAHLKQTSSRLSI